MLDHEASTPDWVRRFTAPSIGFPDWIAGLARPPRDDRQSRRVLAGLGARPVRRRVASAERRTRWGGVGLDAARRPGGVVARRRPATNEAPSWRLRSPGGTAAPVFPEMPEGWLTGLSFEAGRSALSVEVDGTYRIFVVEADGDDARDRLVLERRRGWATSSPRAGGGLSADGSLLCVWHSEHGDILHASLRVLDVATGATVGELEDERAVPPTRRLVPRPRRSAAGVHERARRLRAAGDLGPGHAACDRRSPSSCRAPSSRCSGGRTARAPRASRVRGSRAAAPARPGHRREHAADRPRRRHRRGPHPAGRRRLVPRQRRGATRTDPATPPARAWSSRARRSRAPGTRVREPVRDQPPR